MANITFNTDNLDTKVVDLLEQLAATLSLDTTEEKSAKPDIDEEYYYIKPNGLVGSQVWDGGVSSEAFYDFGNCFESYEEAEFIAEKVKVITELKRYAEKHNGTIDWSDCEQKKYKPAYNIAEGKLDPTYCKEKATGGVYFSSYDLCMEAMTEVGEERVKRYLLEI